MKPILILCTVVVLVHSRPEAPSGYNYPAPPSSRYGAPSGGQGLGQAASGGANGGSGSGGGSGLGGGSGFGGGSGLGGGSGFGSGSGAGAGSGVGTSGQSGRGASAGADSGNIIINKHVYVHVAPPELEDEPQQRAQVRVPQPQKNYKIIFIKAPVPAATQAPEIPPIPQNEEKTLVYVLVKKPEEQADIEIPTQAPTEPSRPEVYFIRYKTQQESGDQQGATGGNDFSDTVEVGAARQGGGANGQNGAGAGQGNGGNGANGAGGPQGGASAGGYARSSSASASVSRQYGAPNSSGPY